MTGADLAALASNEADLKIAYGSDPNQYGELRLPPGPGPHPVVVLIHGGCWMAMGRASLMGAMGDALKADGIATWNIEYRRLPQPGSGWPGTYLDVGQALDHLRAIAGKHRLDLGRVVVVGHSAGAHLAMWTALRHKLPKDSPLFIPNPLPLAGIVNLAGRIDMTEDIEHYHSACRGNPVVTNLLGGTPLEVPERYRQVSVNRFLPLGVPQVLVWGDQENYVPKELAMQYVQAAERAGDAKVRLLVVPNAGHFETASPASSTWPAVRDTIRTLLAGKP